MSYSVSCVHGARILWRTNNVSGSYQRAGRLIWVKGFDPLLGMWRDRLLKSRGCYGSMKIPTHVNSTSLQFRNAVVLGAIGSLGPEQQNVLRTGALRLLVQQGDFDLSIRSEREPLLQCRQESHRNVARRNENTHVCIVSPQGTDKLEMLSCGKSSVVQI